MAAIDDIYGTPGSDGLSGTARSQTAPGGVRGARKAGTPGLAGVDMKPEVNNTSLAGRETDDSGKVVAQKPMTYAQMYETFAPGRPETAEEKAKREKREKSEAVLAAVGDGISALSNLFFTTRGARSSYNASQGMSARTRERWDKLRQEREANSKAWFDGYVRARAMDDTNARDDRTWRHTLEREKIADDRYEAQAKLEEKKAKLDEQLRLHQITAAEYKAEQERISALYAEGTEQLKQDSLRAGIKQKGAAATASLAAAGASNAKAESIRSGGGGGGKHGLTLQLEDDEPMRFGDDKDYDRTVMRLAPDYGVPTTVVEVTERDRKGNPKKQRTVKRDVKDIAADIEREAAKRKKEGNHSQISGSAQQSSTSAKGNADTKWSNTSNIKW